MQPLHPGMVSTARVSDSALVGGLEDRAALSPIQKPTANEAAAVAPTARATFPPSLVDIRRRRRRPGGAGSKC